MGIINHFENAIRAVTSGGLVGGLPAGAGVLTEGLNPSDLYFRKHMKKRIHHSYGKKSHKYVRKYHHKGHYKKGHTPEWKEKPMKSLSGKMPRKAIYAMLKNPRTPIQLKKYWKKRLSKR